MKCKRFISLAVGAAFLLIGNYVAAQRTVQGVVYSSQHNVPLSGVSVTVPGTKIGTFTSPSGSYSLTVPDTASILSFSYIGYSSQNIHMLVRGGDRDINVTLYPDSANDLGDVVVIGYGAVRKQDVSGSVATVSAKDFQTGAITSFDQAIQGKTAGVMITPGGGSPGTSGNIVIRGISTLSGNTGPLVVVDGIPYGQYVNPDDIASVTVLKDAASTAIYGSQGTNGVILITTKKGRAGGIKFDFNTQFAEQTVAKYMPVLNTTQYKDLVNENPGGLFTSYQNLLGTANTNWQKQVYQTAPMSNSNLSVSGAIGKWLPFHASFGFLDQDGILRTDNMKRGTGAISLTPSFFQNHLKVELNLNGSLTGHRNPDWGAIGGAITFDPTQAVYDSNNTYFGGYYQWMTNPNSPNSNAAYNPVAQLMQRNDHSNYNRGSGNLRLDYSLHFLPELHVMANFGFDADETNGYTLIDTNARSGFNSSYPNMRGTNNIYSSKDKNYFAEYTISYDKDIPSIKSHINAMGMYAFYSWSNTQYNYPSRDWYGDTIPGTVPTFATDLNRNTLVSYIGRLIYTYNEKYVLTLSYRDDGSSKLAPAHRWVGFGAASFAWNIAKENFLKNSNVVSTLKLRLSYGTTANQGGIGNYGYYSGYYIGTSAQTLYQMGNQWYYMYAPSTYNAGLTWETTTSPDFGLDFGFLHDRISGSIDWYDKHTKNLLVQSVFVPMGSNYSNTLPSANVGDMTSKGLEINLNFIPVQTKHVEWDINFNAAYNKNVITKLTGSDTTTILVGGIAGGTSSTIQALKVGAAPFSYYVLQQVYDQNGKPIEGAYVDRNGDGIVNDADKYLYHSPFPAWTFGFSTSVRVDRWTFGTVLRANVGQYAYNNKASTMGVVGNLAINQYLANANTSVLKTGFLTEQLYSDYYVENASFLKMDNISVSYNIGSLDKAKKTNLTVSANVQNVFTITKYTGITPDLSYNTTGSTTGYPSYGIDNQIYPVPRTYTLGINFNF